MQRFCASRSLLSAASRTTRPRPRFSPARIPKSHHGGFRCARALSSHPQSVAGASTSTSTSTPNPSPRESEEHAELSEHDLRFGLYDVILPEEPFVWGTAHILPRPVPAWIARPPYVDDPAGAANASTERRLITDAADVVRLRRAAELARRALELAGSLVAVSVYLGSLQDMRMEGFNAVMVSLLERQLGVEREGKAGRAVPRRDPTRRNKRL